MTKTAKKKREAAAKNGQLTNDKDGARLVAQVPVTQGAGKAGKALRRACSMDDVQTVLSTNVSVLTDVTTVSMVINLLAKKCLLAEAGKLLYQAGVKLPLNTVVQALLLVGQLPFTDEAVAALVQATMTFTDNSGSGGDGAWILPYFKRHACLALHEFGCEVSSAHDRAASNGSPTVVTLLEGKKKGELCAQPQGYPAGAVGGRPGRGMFSGDCVGISALPNAGCAHSKSEIVEADIVVVTTGHVVLKVPGSPAAAALLQPGLGGTPRRWRLDMLATRSSLNRTLAALKVVVESAAHGPPTSGADKGKIGQVLAQLLTATERQTRTDVLRQVAATPICPGARAIAQSLCTVHKLNESQSAAVVAAATQVRLPTRTPWWGAALSAAP